MRATLCGFILLLFFSGTFFFGCSGGVRNNGSRPVNDSTVSENTMIAILADMHIIEAGLTSEKNVGAPTDSRRDILYEGLFRKYGISRKKYESSLKYYNNNPKEFSKLYAKVISRIELEQEIVNRKRR